MHIESGIEELRKLIKLANNTNECVFDGLSIHAIVFLLQACRKSTWDITPDDLTEDEIRFAVINGKLSTECLERLERDL